VVIFSLVSIAELRNEEKARAAGLGNVGGLLGSSELYDPDTENWTETGGLNTAHWLHTAKLPPAFGGRNDSYVQRECD
jgi:hypothetical protein